jgi:hypothetical protein
MVKEFSSSIRLVSPLGRATEISMRSYASFTLKI